MRCNVVKLAVFLAGFVCLAPAAGAQPSSPAVADSAAAWKMIYQDNQTIYYIDTTDTQRSGQSTIRSLIQYRIPRVVNSAQVWSVVSHMKLDCDQKQIVTIDNILYALKMGAGPVVQSQASNDTWHQPQPDSLGGLIWSAACGKP
jgi:hypothetical protein